MRRFSKILSLLLLASLLPALAARPALAAAGDLDPTFDGDGKRTDAVGTGTDVAYAVAIQADGKIVAAGFSYNGTNNDFAVVRYNTDGTLDTSFDGDGKRSDPVGSGNDAASAVAIQTDGRIVAAGYSYNGTNYDFAVARYNTNGSLDTSFDGDGKRTDAIGSSDDLAYAVAIQADGKIVVAGHSRNASGNYDLAIVRYYTTTGGLDTSFDGDGKRTDPIGSADDLAYAVAIQADGKIVVAGTSVNGTKIDFAVVRYNKTGTLDTSFDADGKRTDAIGSGNDLAYAVAIQPDRKIVLAGYSYNGTNNDFAIVRYNTTGTLDTTFDGDGKRTDPIGSLDDFAYAVAIQPDGKIVLAGYSVNASSDDDVAVVRYNTTGTLDTTFDGDGKRTDPIGTSDDFARGVAIQPDGKIVLAGYSLIGSTYDFAVVRYLAATPTLSVADAAPRTESDGQLSFDITLQNGTYPLTTVQYETVAGTATPGLDYTSVTGSVTFGYGQTTKTIVVPVLDDIVKEPDETLSLHLLSANASIVRSTALATILDDDAPEGAGTLDPTFDGGGKRTDVIGTGNDYANAVALQPDGRIVVAGYGWNGVNNSFAAVRYNADGTLDTSFDGDGKRTDNNGGNAVANGVAIQADGKIVLAGYSFLQANRFAVARYNADGTRDLSLDGDGWVVDSIGGIGDEAYAVAIQPDGKIVLGGSSWNGSHWNFAVARYNADGTRDTSFDGDGKRTDAIGTGNDYGRAVAIQPDGKIVLAGYSLIGSTTEFAAVRYNADGSLDTSFDGDGKRTDAIGTSDDTVYAVAIQPDGKIVLAGDTLIGSTTEFAALRYNADGSLDTSFDGDGKRTDAIGTSNTARGVAIQPDGKIVLVGSSLIGSTFDVGILRYNTNGSLDTSFDGDGKRTDGIGVTDIATAVAIQPDGKIVLAGYSAIGSTYDFAVARYLGASPSLSVADAAPRDESEGQLSFDITLQNGTLTTVQYETVPGTATAGVDFTSLTGSVTFGSGETTKTVFVPVLDDTLVEPAETLSLHLLSANASIVRAYGNGTIIDDDAPSIALGSATGPPKSTLQVTGGSFTPNDGAELYFDTTFLRLVTVASNGTISASITVPPGAQPGTHWVTVKGSDGRSAQQPFTVASSWLQFHYDSRRRGSNPLENVLDTSIARDLDQAWVASPGGSAVSAPAVQGLTSVYVSDGTSNVRAYDAVTGTLRWTRTFSAGVTSSTPAAVSDDRLFVGGSDQKTRALSVATGAVLWTSTASGGAVTGAPVISGTRIYTASAAGKVSAYPLTCGVTCSPSFTMTVAGGISPGAAPAVSGGVLYVGSTDTKLYAFDAAGATGCSGTPKVCSPLWTSGATGGPIQGSPAVSGGIVYVNDGEPKLYAFDAATGASLWDSADLMFGGVNSSSPAVAGGRVFLGDSAEGNVYAFDADSGAFLWKSATSTGAANASPAVANGVVYAATDGGRVLALDPVTGAKLWAARAQGAAGSPAVVNGIVYVGTAAGKLYAFQAQPITAVARPDPRRLARGTG